MKHYVPLVLFPYMLLLDLFLFLRSGHVGALPAAAGCAVVVLAVALNAAGLFLVARCLIRAGKDACTGTAGGRAGPELAGRVLAVKLLHIPAYLCMFVIGFSVVMLPLGFLITLMCFCIDCWTIALSGLLMTFALVAKCRRGEIPVKRAVLHSVLAFLFCIDVADAFYVKHALVQKV